MNIETLLSDKLRICRELKIHLDKIINNEKGSKWGYEQVESIENYFCQLKLIDNKILTFKNNDQSSENCIILIAEIKQTMLAIKNQMAIFEIRLRGARALILAELMDISKAMDIKGYGNMAKPFMSTASCLC